MRIPYKSLTCFEFVSNLFRTCFERVSNLFRTCFKRVWNLFQTCFEQSNNFVTYFYDPIFTWDPCHPFWGTSQLFITFKMYYVNIIWHLTRIDMYILYGIVVIFDYMNCLVHNIWNCRTNTFFSFVSFFLERISCWRKLFSCCPLYYLFWQKNQSNSLYKTQNKRYFFSKNNNGDSLHLTSYFLSSFPSHSYHHLKHDNFETSNVSSNL